MYLWAAHFGAGSNDEDNVPWITNESLAPVKTFQNGVRTTGRAFHSPNWRVKGEESPSAQSAGSPGPKTNTSRIAFSRPSPHVPQAISEGRRLYVGNMPYTAKSEDVQALFTAAEFTMYEWEILYKDGSRLSAS